MTLWKTYLQPQTVESALESLRDNSPNAVIAGGTDLLLDLQQGRHPPVEALIDVSGIDEMRQIGLEGDNLIIGAAATLRSIIASPLVQAQAACLIEGCSLIGGPQVRNVATLGGNVAHALPAGDGTIALLALGAEAQLASVDSRRWVPLETLFAGPGKPTFDRASEILVGFRIPTRRKGQGSAFHRVMRPQRVAIAILNMAAWVHCSSDGHMEDVRLAAGPAGPRPFRARGTEDVLRGHRLDQDVITKAHVEMLAEVKLRTSPHRATAEYRQHLIPIILKQVLGTAYERAGHDAAVGS